MRDFSRGAPTMASDSRRAPLPKKKTVRRYTKKRQTHVLETETPGSPTSGSLWFAKRELPQYHGCIMCTTDNEKGKPTSRCTSKHVTATSRTAPTKFRPAGTQAEPQSSSHASSASRSQATSFCKSTLPSFQELDEPRMVIVAAS